jgi:hypothetical protein
MYTSPLVSSADKNTWIICLDGIKNGQIWTLFSLQRRTNLRPRAERPLRKWRTIVKTTFTFLIKTLILTLIIEENCINFLLLILYDCYKYSN